MKKKCNICNKKFINFLSLGNHPCADTFLKKKNQAKKLKKYPLIVGFCKCSHLTSLFPVPKKIRYEKYDYSYTSDNSPVSRSHFKKIAIKIIQKFKIDNNSFVVEAGSNDGTFLQSIRKFSEAKLLGVDPSKNICNIAKKKNIKTLNNYFNYLSSISIKKKYGSADVIYGANVFNHVDNSFNFLKGAHNLIRDSGVLIIEVPDLKSLVEKVGFDTIYHEHRHYYSEKSINKVFLKANFQIFKIESIRYMAGSIRVYAKKIIKNKKTYYNKKLSFVTLKEFTNFKKKIFYVIEEVKKFVDTNIKKKKIIHAIGAATKGNTLLNCCKLNDKKIKFILEKSKHKINKFTPSSSIKIINENSVKNIEVALILPWNITDHLIKKFSLGNKILYTSIQKIVKKLND